MKIISLSSSVAGPACAIATSIKKYFYNNNYITNIFDYLEISLTSILEILRMQVNDIQYLSHNNFIEKNIDNNYSVTFRNFNKIISHHDLKNNYTNEDYINFIEKYKRRYFRLLNDIYNEKIIFFIRYGNEEIGEICEFIELIKLLNSNLHFYFIQILNNKDIKSLEYLSANEYSGSVNSIEANDSGNILSNNNKIPYISSELAVIEYQNYIKINLYNDKFNNLESNNYINTINLEWFKVYNLINNKLEYIKLNNNIEENIIFNFYSD
jgi:hypothetical protein